MWLTPRRGAALIAAVVVVVLAIVALTGSDDPRDTATTVTLTTPARAVASRVVPGTAGRLGDRYDLAAAPNGALAVAFEDSRPGRGTGAVRVALRRGDGRWAAPQTVSGGRFAAVYPRIVLDARGRATVAWVRSGCPFDGGSGCALRYVVQARSQAASGGWGPVRTLGPAVVFDPSLRIAADAGGDVAIAWASPAGVRASYRRAGGRFGPAKAFAHGVFEDGGAIAVAIGAGGRALVAWSTGTAADAGRRPPRPFVAVSLRSRGTGWSVPRRVSRRPATQPHAAVAADGASVVAWREAVPDNARGGVSSGGVGAATTPLGAPFGVAQHVADAQTSGVLLAAARSGETVLAWADAAGRLRFAVRAAGAAAFGAPAGAPGVTIAVRRAALATRGDGTAFVVSDVGGAIVLSRRPPGATFGAARALSSRGMDPAVAASGSTAAAAWREGRGLRVANLP
jgi:hypothetical protein